MNLRPVILNVLLAIAGAAGPVAAQSLPPLPPPPTPRTNALVLPMHQQDVRIRAVIAPTNGASLALGQTDLPGPVIGFTNRTHARVLWIDWSTDLRHWRPWGWFTNVEALAFTDGPRTNRPSVFYRALGFP